MQREISWATGTEREPYFLAAKADAEFALGKIKLGHDSFRQAEASAIRNGMREFAASLKASEAARDAGYGNCSAARTQAAASLAENPVGLNRQIVSFALAQCGDFAAAQKLVAAEDQLHPQDTLLHAVNIPVVQALTKLQHGNAAEAVSALEAGRPYETGGGFGYPAHTVFYVRGLAYLRMKEGEKAAAEFQKILDRRSVQPMSELIPLAQLNLARARALQGDTGKARTAYQDFFAAWKDADPDVPVLLQAKSEYAKLH